MSKVYILPIEEVKAYIRGKYPNDIEKQEDFVLHFNDKMTEKECKEILEASEDAVANSMTIKEFQGEFNFALEDGEITSARYLIKFF